MSAENKKIFVAVNQPGDDESLFFRLWGLINMEGPLTRLPEPARSEIAADLERMRRQQVHVDEIKRLCHVPR